MKFLVYSDLQADEGSQRTFGTGESLQLWRVKKFYARLREIYRERKCAGLIDLGDTLDNRSHISLPVAAAVSEGLEPFEGENNWKIIGNHEQWIKDASIHSGPFFRSFFSVCSSYAPISLGGRNVFLASFPAAGKEGELIEAMTEFSRQHKQGILFGHFHVDGARIGKSGPMPGNIPKSAVSGFRLGLLGHIHNQQEVTKGVCYLGSPFQQDFGEASERKYVAILDTDEPLVTYVAMEDFPVYRQASLDRWEEDVRENSEDRYKVNLKSLEESSRFFAHPLAYRAIPVPLFESSMVPTIEESGKEPVDFERAYVKQVKYDHIGDLTEDEMLELGRSFS